MRLWSRIWHVCWRAYWEEHEAMGSRPYMPLYVGDYLRRTAALSPDARGCYLELLMWWWEQDADLPPDLLARMQIARCVDRYQWKKVWSAIEPLLDGDNCRDPWLEERRAEMNAFDSGVVAHRDQQSARGRASAQARRQKYGTAQPPKPEPRPNRFDEPRFEQDSELAANSQLNARRTDGSADLRTSYISEDQKNEEHKEQSPPSASTVLSPTNDDLEPSLPVLTKLAHDVFDEVDAGRMSPDATDREGWFVVTLKVRAARLHLAYNTTAVLKAVRSAEAQRQRQTPDSAARRLVREFLASHPQGRLGVPADEVRAALFQVVERTWPAASFADWRDAVVRLAWQESTWRTEPTVAYEGGMVRLK